MVYQKDLIKSIRLPRLFFGWWTVIASGILCLWGYGYSSSGFSALFKPIASELNFGRAVTSVAQGIVSFEAAFLAPLSGWMTDRFGPRWMVFFGVFLISLGLVLMNFIGSLPAFFVVWGLLVGGGFNIALAIPLDTAISNWFVRKRGLAIGIKWTFSGLSGVLALPFIAWLISVYNWRMTCFFGGIVMGIIGLPLAWFCFKRYRPEHYGLLPDGATDTMKEPGQMMDRGREYAAKVEEFEFTLRQTVKTPAFWLLVAAQASFGLAHAGIHVHCIPFLTDIGITPLKAASMMALIYLASIPSRFFGGFFLDRMRRDQLRFLLAGAYLLQAVGGMIFLLNQSITTIYVWFIIYGLGMGATYAVISPLMARYFGRKAFGSISGTMAMLTSPFSVVAPVYAGWVYDTSGSYITAFTLFAILYGVATVLAFFAIRPAAPVHVTSIGEIV